MASSSEPVTLQIEALNKVHNENADREKKDLKRKLAETKNAWRFVVKHMMTHLNGCQRKAKSFLAPKLSWKTLRRIARIV